MYGVLSTEEYCNDLVSTSAAKTIRLPDLGVPFEKCHGS